jgi:pimeloyl-ACP methyl ester carboxylesterase
MHSLTRKINLTIILSVFFLVSFAVTFSAHAALSTTQPLEGPGSAAYCCTKIIKNHYNSGARKYHLFEPDDPTLEKAPLIVFLHGLMATATSTYGDWIEHIVKKGNIVIYPAYQSIIPIFPLMNSYVIDSVLDAIQVLQSEGHVKPDLDKFALVGHSCGGVLAPNVAALAEESGLPTPRAVMAVAPGITPIIQLEDLEKIPPETLLLAVVGDSDFMAGDRDAKKVFRRTPQIPLENKDYITLVSDRHGGSSIIASHLAPCCFGKEDALDGYAYWKLFDALTDAAFYGINREYALGNTPEQRYMGEWSDGTLRKEMMVTDNP